MPTDLLKAIMLENTLSDIQQLEIKILFFNGSVVMLPGGPACNFERQTHADQPLQSFGAGPEGAVLSGNMRSVSSKLWVKCQTNVLTGMLSVSHPLPVDVDLSSSGGKGKVTLTAGQTLLGYELPVADYKQSTSEMADPLNELNLPGAC